MSNATYPTIRQNKISLAQQAVSYVESKMTIGAGNKVSDLFTSILAPEWSATCVARIRKEPYTGDTVLAKLRMMAYKASSAGCGNCGEQAAIAFIWLHDRGVGPLDYMSRTNADHTFVVIGRNAYSSLDSPSDWGDNCVVRDPWDEKAYYANNIGKKNVWRGNFSAALCIPL